jgi:hypothetical protein
MKQLPRAWRWESHAPLRGDAEGLFVPQAELPKAVVGDIVHVEGPEHDGSRSGRITATTEADGAQFFRLKLDP